MRRRRRFGIAALLCIGSLPLAAETLWNAYDPDIKGWINARGGLTPDFKWMRAPNTYTYFKTC